MPAVDIACSCTDEPANKAPRMVSGLKGAQEGCVSQDITDIWCCLYV